MHILVINPNTSQNMSAAIKEVCERAASAETTIEVVNPESGPVSIESFTEDAMATAAMVRLVVEHPSRYDAIIVACFDDPGLSALREITSVPVLGIAESAAHMASLISPNFGVVTTTERAYYRLSSSIKRSGLWSRCVGIRGTSLSVLETEDTEKSYQEMIQAGTKSIEKDGAECLILGCAGLGPLDASMTEHLGVPVLDGCACAVKLAEGLYGYGLSVSKRSTFATPPKKQWVDDPQMSRIFGG